VIDLETTDAVPARPGSNSRIDLKPCETVPSEPATFRVVHTSGEMLVASEAEAKALLTLLPGARVFCAGSARH